MHVVVCVKQVPDTTRPWSDPVNDTRISANYPGQVTPGDLAALECALTLKDRYEARVTLLCMGPPEAKQALQHCLAYRADHAVLLSDAALAGSDTFATSYALSAAIRRLAADDAVTLVLCGERSFDGATGQTGPGLARQLGWQQITFTLDISEVNQGAGTIMAERLLERGRERVRTQLPAVITLSAAAPVIRYASLPNLLRALRATPEIWTAQDVAAEEAFVGFQGSPTRMQRIFAPPTRASGEIVVVEQVGLEAAVTPALRFMKPL